MGERVLQCDNGLLLLVLLINSMFHKCFTALHAVTGENPSRAHETAFSKAYVVDPKPNQPDSNTGLIASSSS